MNKPEPAIDGPTWFDRIVAGLADASPALPNAATGPRPRTSYWRNLWNALRGRR